MSEIKELVKKINFPFNAGDSVCLKVKIVSISLLGNSGYIDSIRLRIFQATRTGHPFHKDIVLSAQSFLDLQEKSSELL